MIDEPAVLFRSRDLIVRRVGAAAGPACIVTFASYTQEPTLDREGFGEGFLRDRGIPAIHVISRTNAWYHYPEMREAITAIAAATGAYASVMTYGSSMGGYAALRFAQRCGANTAIAISPQFSILRRNAPFETRWQADAAKIRTDDPPFDPAQRQIIFYDPRMALDAKQVARFVHRDARIELISLPYAGHPVGPILAETGVLKEAIPALIAGRFDARGVERTARERRRQSQHHFFMLARRARDRRPHLAIALMRRAAAIEPESHIASELGGLLDQVGAHGEARGWHRAAVRRTRSNVRARILLALHLEATGRPRTARRVIGHALAEQSGAIRLILRTHQLRLALRRHKLGAVDRAIGRLLRTSEGSPLYAVTVRGFGRWLR